MEKKQHQKENAKIILNTIVSANKDLYAKIKEQFPNLTAIQEFTILLLKLNYSSNEIRIILEIPAERIDETSELLKKS